MIKIICIGKLKEKYLVDLTTDYKARISKYNKIEILELKDSDILDEEYRILKSLNEKDYIISLDIKGKKLNSIEFKERIELLFNKGIPNITFIIGGSFGISKKVLEKSNEIISFGNLTFPHGLFRGMLLEQIYRTFKIMNNETYHK